MKRVVLLLCLAFLAGASWLVPLAKAQDHFQVGAYGDYFRIDQTGSNISYVVRPSRIPPARLVSAPIASPIFGSKPKSNVQVGASATPSSVMNS